MTSDLRVQANGKRLRDEDDDLGNMFDESVSAASALNSARTSTRAIGSLNKCLRDAKMTGPKADCDDEDGYYVATVGDLIGDRYLVVQNACGRGVYASIVKARDKEDSSGTLVAIKIVRANETMLAAAEREASILETLQTSKGESKRHIVHLLSKFYFCGHACLVFECMWDDLREALRKHTKGRGMTLTAVRSYARQLLAGLLHMHRCNVIHADIKPDNILINEDLSIVKWCDLGTAADAGDALVNPYMMSGFYRAPEILLGCKLTVAVDIFALACTLYELFTGKILLTGKNNSEQLKKVVELKGDIPTKVVKAGTLHREHFDDKLRLKTESGLGATGGTPPSRRIKDLVLERVGLARCQSSSEADKRYVRLGTDFADFLERLLDLNPKERPSACEAMKHPFFLDAPRVAA